MTKDELKAEAKKLGLKVRDNFMDDWPENTAILAVGCLIGYAAGYFKLFL